MLKKKKNQICIYERYKSVFYLKKFRFASNEDADPFFIKKNSNLHLRKM